MANAWDHYVLAHPQASLFHLTGWKRVLKDTFNYSSYYLYAEHKGRITGVVPLFLISNPIVGKCLMSVPFGVYGGIVADDESSTDALLQHIKDLACSLKVDYLELRSRNSRLFAGFHANLRYATFTAQLSGDVQANLKRLPRDTRYMIRKGEKAGLTTRHGVEQMALFYDLFAQNMREHGTPVFPRVLFDKLLREFQDQIDVMVVYAGTRAITGVVSFIFRDTIYPYYAGVSPFARPLAGNNFMYWELMKWAIECGIQKFDFGRSKKGTGAYAFKMGWNMVVESLDYQVYLVRRKTPPNFSPTNPIFEFATGIWRKMPLWTTLILGPRVSPWFP
jgi:FemAB-related protein (PEP-CTERM system-associated)